MPDFAEPELHCCSLNLLCMLTQAFIVRSTACKSPEIRSKVVLSTKNILCCFMCFQKHFVSAIELFYENVKR